MKHLSMNFYKIPLIVKTISDKPSIGGSLDIEGMVNTFGSIHGGRKHAFEKNGRYIIPQYKVIIPYELPELKSFDHNILSGYIEFNDPIRGYKSYKIDYCSPKYNPDGSFHHFSLLIGGEENES